MAVVIQFSKPNERDRKRCDALLIFLDEINQYGMSAVSWLSFESFMKDLSKEFIDLNCKQKVLDGCKRIDEMIEEHIKKLGDKQ